MPSIRIHCPRCGFSHVSDSTPLSSLNLRVECPQCGHRFPLAAGLVASRFPWTKWLKTLLGWLLLPFGYLALVAIAAFLSALCVVIAPLILIVSFVYPKLHRELGFTRLGFFLYGLWPAVNLLPLTFPLFLFYHFAWSVQPFPLLAPLSVLAGVTPNQIAMMHVAMAGLSIALLLLYLARLVPEKLAQLRELQLLVPSKARSAAIGLVELEGVLRIVPPHDGNEKSRWYLEDDSGRIPLDPAREANPLSLFFGDDLHEMKRGLSDGDYVYLLGHVHLNPQAQAGTLDAGRLVVRPVREPLLPDPLWRRLFRRQRTLHDTPDVFVLIPGGERRAQALLRRQLINKAALSLAMVAAAVWMLNAETPRLHGTANWSAAEVAAASEPLLLQMIATGSMTEQQRAAAVFFGRWTEFGRPEFGRNDPQRPEWVAPTVQLLRHPDPATRQLAFRAAGTLRSAAETVAPELLALAGAPQAVVRAAAADALGQLQAQPGKSVAALTGLLQHDPDAAVRTRACVALAAFDQGDALSSACLRERLSAARGEPRRELARALAQVTGDGTQVVPMLAVLLADPDPDVRVGAARGLGAHKAAAAVAVPELFAALRDERDESVRYPLLLACGEIGPAAAPVVPLLLAELRALHGQRHTRRDTLFSVLRHIGPGAVAALPDLIGLLEEPETPDDEVRTIIIIFDSFGPAARPALPMVQAIATSDSNAELRQIARWFLTRFSATERSAGTANAP